MANILKAILGEVATRSDYLKLQDNIGLAVKESQAISVFSERELDLAGNYIKKYKEISKEIELIRKSIVDPLNKDVKIVNEFFKNIGLQYKDELERLNDEVTEFLVHKREREAEERMKEQQELEDSLISEAEIFEDESVLNVIPQIEIKRESLGEMTSTITTARIKKWRVVDIDKVPRAYLLVDERMIGEIRKDYDFEVVAQPIDGIEFYYDEVIRSK